MDGTRDTSDEKARELRYLMAFLNPTVLVPILFAILAFLTIVGIALPFAHQDPVKERI